MFCSYSCEKLADHTYILRVQNNTKDTIQVYAGYNYPDTALNVEKPILKIGYPDYETRLESKTDWKDKLQGDTLSIFILSKDTVDTYSWEDIRSEYNILKRYDMSISDLESQNWTITYP
ncbi:hypothetical protein SAMN05444380_101214 [Thermophagus xiamenensis]|uniref:Uncharacterized protein n=2 Tax=Thermophagus xiamenensis TaxID=385682 RepID=A0A1I1UVJ0_9BACT|nr:hypothetical protein SAMN05444380_101214 [Thermophagus xiamenensis]